MDEINFPMKFDRSNHTPPSMKQNEWYTLYNPFYYDLSATKVTINPEWASAPGITLMWLVQSHDGATRLILGVEADSPGNFLAFADRFATGHNITAKDAVFLYKLGHPTLAHIGNGLAGDDELNMDEVEKYAGDLANYTGIMGGELRFEQDSWWINDLSGRYGSQRQQGNFAVQDRIRTHVLGAVKKAFLQCAGIEVGIREP